MELQRAEEQEELQTPNLSPDPPPVGWEKQTSSRQQAADVPSIMGRVAMRFGGTKPLGLSTNRFSSLVQDPDDERLDNSCSDTESLPDQPITGEGYV